MADEKLNELNARIETARLNHAYAERQLHEAMGELRKALEEKAQYEGATGQSYVIVREMFRLTNQAGWVSAEEIERMEAEL